MVLFCQDHFLIRDTISYDIYELHRMRADTNPVLEILEEGLLFVPRVHFILVSLRFLKSDLLGNEAFIIFERYQRLRCLKTVGLGVRLFCTCKPFNVTLFISRILSFYFVEFDLF